VSSTTIFSPWLHTEFASSQAYVERYKNNKAVISSGGQDPLKFKRVAGDVYQWLGFEAYELIFGLLDEIVADRTLTVDIFAYDLSEPDIVSRQKLGNRVRAVIDNSGDHKRDNSPESEVARLLSKSEGGANVTRMHFNALQQNKVLIAKKNGKPVKVLFGSTNFSFRGIYIQANNALVLYSPEAAGMFAQIFELAFTAPTKFKSNALSQKWHLLSGTSHPPVHFCFSPHVDSDLSLNPLAAAIDQATSSVFFDIAFFNQMKSGPTVDAIDRLMDKYVFSYGISNNAKGLNVKKLDGSIGFVDFAYLAKNTSQPFAGEWSGIAASVKKSGKKSAPRINQHDKFVVTDFRLPTAKVFTGSSNLSVNGEEKNGDNLVMIEDPKVATSYAIEAIRIFDHCSFARACVPILPKKQTRISKSHGAQKAHGDQRTAGVVCELLQKWKPGGKRSAAFCPLAGSSPLQLESNKIMAHLDYGFVKCKLVSEPKLQSRPAKHEVQYHLHVSLQIPAENGDETWDTAINMGTNDADDLPATGWSSIQSRDAGELEKGVFGFHRLDRYISVICARFPSLRCPRQHGALAR
jgi:phosphatidylserine/phosphatidylglycerophosphate/cardiolipin synthase-like enzyme